MHRAMLEIDILRILRSDCKQRFNARSVESLGWLLGLGLPEVLEGLADLEEEGLVERDLFGRPALTHLGEEEMR